MARRATRRPRANKSNKDGRKGPESTKNARSRDDEEKTVPHDDSSMASTVSVSSLGSEQSERVCQTSSHRKKSKPHNTGKTKISENMSIDDLSMKSDGLEEVEDTGSLEPENTELKKLSKKKTIEPVTPKTKKKAKYVVIDGVAAIPVALMNKHLSSKNDNDIPNTELKKLSKKKKTDIPDSVTPKQKMKAAKLKTLETGLVEMKKSTPVAKSKKVAKSALAKPVIAKPAKPSKKKKIVKAKKVVPEGSRRAPSRGCKKKLSEQSEVLEKSDVEKSNVEKRDVEEKMDVEKSDMDGNGAGHVDAKPDGHGGAFEFEVKVPRSKDWAGNKDI